LLALRKLHVCERRKESPRSLKSDLIRTFEKMKIVVIHSMPFVERHVQLKGVLTSIASSLISGTINNSNLITIDKHLVCVAMPVLLTFRESPPDICDFHSSKHDLNINKNTTLFYIGSSNNGIREQDTVIISETPSSTL
jgi:hypothetical protein